MSEITGTANEGSHVAAEFVAADRLLAMLACDHHRCGTAHPPPFPS
jgi:hypothetical protein